MMRPDHRLGPASLRNSALSADCNVIVFRGFELRFSGLWLAGTSWSAHPMGADRGGRAPSERRAPRFGEITRLPHHVISQAGALFVMDDTR